ncbi:MAG: FtsQ-type POTRA domain-containing protein [Peptococcaceae bacterium]|nr:FtsQ-type POTRA domain-containing protein [Peptococcaceae bacterium]
MVIPEEYLAYERQAEEKKYREERLKEILNQDADIKSLEARVSDEATATEAEEDPFSRRIEEILNEKRQSFADELPPEEAPTQAEKDVASEKKPQVKRQRMKKERTSKPEKSTKDNKMAGQKTVPAAFVVFLVVLVFATAFFAVLLGPMMKIDHVEVTGVNHIDEQKIIEMAGNPVGQNLLLYHVGDAKTTIEDYPYVREVKIKRHLPHWLEIDVTERTPAGVMLNNGSYLQFSKDGVLLDSAKSLSSYNLPVVTGFSMKDVPSPGEHFKDNARFEDVLKIVNACSDELLTMIQEINVKDRNNILAYTSQGLEVRIGNVDQIRTRMRTLEDIMNQVILSNVIEEPIEAIDIRFEKSPVIVLEGYDDIDASELVKDDKDTGHQTTDTQDGQNQQQNNDSSATNRATTDGNVTGQMDQDQTTESGNTMTTGQNTSSQYQTTAQQGQNTTDSSTVNN